MGDGCRRYHGRRSLRVVSTTCDACDHDQEDLRVVDALNVVTAHRLRLTADGEDGRVGLGRDGSRIVVFTVCGSSAARLDLSKAAIGHGVCKVSVVVYGVVVGLDSIGVVDREF